MHAYLDLLLQNHLFHGVTKEAILACIPLEHCNLSSYPKETLITSQNEKCNTLGFILEGSIDMQHFTSSGEFLTVATFTQTESFGASLLYAKKPYYPFSIYTKEKTTLLFIPFKYIKILLRYSFTFNENYMRTLSNQVIVFKQKIEILHQKDVRSRLILYLSLLYEKKYTPSFYLPHRKTEIAALIGVARPSVSREFSNMETDGLIKVEGTCITLLHPSLFTPLKTQ